MKLLFLEEKDSFAIRQMLDADLKAVTRAEAVCFPEEAWSLRDFKELLRLKISEGFLLVEKENPGKIIGYLLGYRFVDEGELINIAVIPEVRGKKLGKFFLSWWLDDLKRDHVEKVYLDVRVSNDSAIGLYRTLGFSDVGVRKRYYQDGEDAVEMMLDFQHTS